MTVKIREVKLKNNTISVMFDIHANGFRRQMISGIKYADIPRDAVEREFKKAGKRLAKKTAAKMELDDAYEALNIEVGYNPKMDFFDYAADFIQRKAPNCEVRTYEAVMKKLEKFLKRNKMPCGAITEGKMIEFKDFLEAELNGISAYNYFKKLKRIFREAAIAKHFRKNPVENIRNTKRKSAEKDTLTTADLKTLMVTHCSNSEVKRAFLFSCYTGLRFCDIILLKWENIKDGYLDIVQKKTDERVSMQLHEMAICLIGTRKNNEQLIFKLPSHTGCLKALRNWAGAAGIAKHVTYHVSRHSFACALLNQDVDIFTVSKLLGHKHMTQTQTYLRSVDAKRQTAINKLPSIM